jgi:hypothetical protein
MNEEKTWAVVAYPFALAAVAALLLIAVIAGLRAALSGWFYGGFPEAE